MKAWLVLIAAIAFGLAPFVTTGFAGFRPDQFPIPQDNAPVQPAGYAFSIWGVIYLWLIVYAVMGVWRYRDDAGWDAPRPAMIVSMGVGAIWIKVATLSVVWAMVLIWVMCLTALWAVFLARPHGPKWAHVLPLGLYAGWLSAASCVALGLTGAGYGIGDASSLVWGWIMVLIAIGFAAMSQHTFVGVWTYGLAVSWALLAIAVKNWGMDTRLGDAACVGALLISGLVLLQLRPRR